MIKVNVIGLGYIGLPTTLSMAAAAKVEIIGTDKNHDLVDTLQSGRLTFKEKNLPELFTAALQRGVVFTTCAVAADVYIIAVPTPYDSQSKKIDATYVGEAVKDVLQVAPKGAVIAVESTISPGTMDKVVRPIVEATGFKCGEDIHIAHVPERIIPGNMVYELQHNSRTIGVDDAATGEILRQVYSGFCQGDMVITSIKVAEMTKVVENTSRDIQIAFANELARICHREDIDVYEVIKIANMHPRVNILNPGPGVGGHCISVDPWFLVGDYPDLVKVILAARQVNDDMPQYVIDRTYQIMQQAGISDLSRVGLYGLTYKENVDDTRESPSLQLIEKLKKQGVPAIKCYDPFVTKKIAADQYLDFDSFMDAVDMVVIMVGHSQLKERADALHGKVVYDTRNVVEQDGVYKL